MRAAEEITGHKYETIGIWLKRATSHAQALTQVLATDLQLSQVEIDEFWSFVQKKTGQRASLTREHAGDAWSKTGTVASTLSEDLIEQAVTATVERTHQRSLSWFSDGWRGYRSILVRAYRQRRLTGKRVRPAWVVPAAVTLTQTVKHRDEHGRLLSVEIHAALGAGLEPAGTVHVERLNGALRDRLNALTRKTHVFAKRDATWDALVTLQLFDHNFHRAHRALRLPCEDGVRRYRQRSPAMSLGLADHL